MGTLLNAVLWENLLKVEFMRSPNISVLQKLKMVAIITYGLQGVSGHMESEIRKVFRAEEISKFLTEKSRLSL